jgi:hypothetical protein
MNHFIQSMPVTAPCLLGAARWGYQHGRRTLDPFWKGLFLGVGIIIAAWPSIQFRRRQERLEPQVKEPGHAD